MKQVLISTIYTYVEAVLIITNIIESLKYKKGQVKTKMSEIE